MDAASPPKAAARNVYALRAVPVVWLIPRLPTHSFIFDEAAQ